MSLGHRRRPGVFPFLDTPDRCARLAKQEGQAATDNWQPIVSQILQRFSALAIQNSRSALDLGNSKEGNSMLSEPSIPVANERRAEPRFESNFAPAELSVIDGACITTIPSTIVDLSRSGLKVVADRRISPAQQVRIQMEKPIVFGELRHCRAAGTWFECVVKISDVVSARGDCKRLTGGPRFAGSVGPKPMRAGTR